MKTPGTIILCLCILLLTHSLTKAQRPEIGKPMPDFTLSNVHNFKKKQVSNDDFKGKWLFLDFWFPGCTNCILSFPKVSGYAKAFEGKAAFVMVGLNSDEYKGVEELYDKFRKKQQLQMIYAFDSLIFDRWHVNAMPYIIIIDPNGVVHSITDGRDMTHDKINALLKGEDVPFYYADIERPQFNPITSNGPKSKLIYQSLLTHWNGESQACPLGIKDAIVYLKDTTGMNCSMAILKWLYNLAYTGYSDWTLPIDSLFRLVYPEPVLELKDKSDFEYDFHRDVGKGTYNYNLIVPPGRASIAYVMDIMKNDLKNTFGYDVSIETRELPVWNLIATAGASDKLKTKGGAPYYSPHKSLGTAAGFTARNYSVDKVLEWIIYYLGDGQPPYFDETGIRHNIDIKIDGLTTEWKALRSQLQANGLDLIKGTRSMKVIVIRDPPTEVN